MLSLWSAGKQLTNATDRVYAGLFEAEIMIHLTLPAGWSDMQIKTLSHFSTALGWEVQASMAIPNASSGCRIDACGQHPTAPMCNGGAGSAPEPTVKPQPDSPRRQHHPRRVAAIEKHKSNVHKLPAAQAQAELEKLWEDHTLNESPQRQNKIDHFVVLLMVRGARPPTSDSSHTLSCTSTPRSVY